MRIKIELYASKIPYLYHNRISSLIKKCIQLSDESYYNSVFLSDKPKPFTFSINFGQYDIKQDWIQINESHIVKENVFYPRNNKFYLYFSTFDINLMFHFIQGLNKLKYFEFSRNNYLIVNKEQIIIKIGKITQLKEVEIKEKMFFKTVSPICLENLESKPISFIDSDFEVCFNGNVARILSTWNLDKNFKKDIKIEVIEYKKKIIQLLVSDIISNDSNFLSSSGKPILILTGNEVKFKIIGDKEIIKFLYDKGIGKKTSYGLGMIEVV